MYFDIDDLNFEGPCNYLLIADGRVKIGATSNLATRIKAHRKNYRNIYPDIYVIARESIDDAKLHEDRIKIYFEQDLYRYTDPSSNSQEEFRFYTSCSIIHFWETFTNDPNVDLQLPHRKPGKQLRALGVGRQKEFHWMNVYKLNSVGLENLYKFHHAIFYSRFSKSLNERELWIANQLELIRPYQTDDLNRLFIGLIHFESTDFLDAFGVLTQTVKSVHMSKYNFRKNHRYLFGHELNTDDTDSFSVIERLRAVAGDFGKNRIESVIRIFCESFAILKQEEILEIETWR